MEEGLNRPIEDGGVTIFRSVICDKCDAILPNPNFLDTCKSWQKIWLLLIINEDEGQTNV